MMLKIQLSITGINYILKYIKIENGYFKFNNTEYCILENFWMVVYHIKHF